MAYVDAGQAEVARRLKWTLGADARGGQVVKLPF